MSVATRSRNGGGVGDGGDGGKDEVESRLMLNAITSLVPRKTSGAATSSSLSDGGGADVAVAAAVAVATAALFLERRAAL